MAVQLAPKVAVLGERTDVDEALKERLSKVRLMNSVVSGYIVDLIDLCDQAKSVLDTAVIDNYTSMMEANDVDMSTSEPNDDY